MILSRALIGGGKSPKSGCNTGSHLIGVFLDHSVLVKSTESELPLWFQILALIFASVTLGKLLTASVS